MAVNVPGGVQGREKPPRCVGRPTVSGCRVVESGHQREEGGTRERRDVQTSTIHTSRYGMAVPAGRDRSFRLRSVTSLRWRNFSAAMARVVDGVRMDGDDESLLLSAPPAASSVSPAGGETG
jgi:hypothetical protein